MFYHDKHPGKQDKFSHVEDDRPLVLAHSDNLTGQQKPVRNSYSISRAQHFRTKIKRGEYKFTEYTHFAFEKNMQYVGHPPI